MSQQIKFCKIHNEYYLSAKNDGKHKDCTVTWMLQWDEVIYYLNKLRRIRNLFNDLRIELNC